MAIYILIYINILLQNILNMRGRLKATSLYLIPISISNKLSIDKCIDEMSKSHYVKFMSSQLPHVFKRIYKLHMRA